MSGGSLDYVYYKVQNAVDDMIKEISDNPDWYEGETLELIKNTITFANITAKMLKEVEWLFSGDNGDKSFCRNMNDIADKYGQMDYEELIKERNADE